MASCTNYKDSLDAWDIRSNETPAFLFFVDSVLGKLQHLKSSKMCVSLGIGSGQKEFEFLRLVTPVFNKFYAVDSDHKMCEAARGQFLLSFPGAIGEFREVAVQQWEGPSETVDVILMLHMLYHLNDEERRRLFQRCIVEWLRPGGCAFIVINNRDGNIIDRVLEQFSPTVAQRRCTAGHVLRDLEKFADVVDVEEHTFPIVIDVSNPDDDFLRFLTQYDSQLYLKRDAIKDFLTEIVPDGSARAFNSFIVVRKRM